MIKIFVNISFIVILCLVGYILVSKDGILSKNKDISPQMKEEIFREGVDCGIDAIMFFVNNGQKTIDKKLIYIKAKEIDSIKMYNKTAEGKQ